MSRHIKTRALVLTSLKWRDSSRIVTLFTETEGRIKVIAHGAAREKSAFRGKLETLNLIEAVMAVSESRSLQILTEASLFDDFRHVKNTYLPMVYAFSLMEVLDHVFQEGQGDEIFFQFIMTLIHNLGESERPEIIWWYFLLKLASYLGFRPDFEACSVCGGSESDTFYFVFREGGIHCGRCQAGTGPVRLLKPEQAGFLNRLQKSRHTSVGLEETAGVPDYDYTTLLLDYLNDHVGHPLQINSLELLRA